MTESPLISVIVPVYNSASYLAECIDSLLGQTATDIEIILVDDGSTDDSSSICAQYRSLHADKIKAVRQPNAGQSAARNTGLRLASGKYIAFCDADDAYAPHALEKLVQQLESNPQCDIAVAGYINADRCPAQWNTDIEFRIYTPTECIRRTLYQNKEFHTSVWAKLFRRNVFDEVRFTEGLYYEDLEITSRVYAACRSIAITDSAVYFYRHNPASFINTWHSRRIDTLKATDSIVEFIAAEYPMLLPAAQSRRFSAYYNIYVEALRHDETELAAKCLPVLKEYRGRILRDHNVRIKNKAGALALFLGERFVRLLI